MTLRRPSVKLAIIVLAYHQPQQLARLLSVLRHPDVRLYLHIDRRKHLAPFTKALRDADLYDVVMLPRHASVWGSAQCVDAALAGLAAGMADGCGYFMMISGQDFPLRSLDAILTFAESAGTRSYMAHWPLCESIHRFHGRDRTDFYTYTVLGRRETCIPRGEDASSFNWRGTVLNDLLRIRTAFKPRRHFPPYLEPYQGSTWWNLSGAAVNYILEFVSDHPDYRRYHEHTIIPEEVFFQSILLGTEFADRYEVVADNMRFLNWGVGWHPLTLTTADLPSMIASNKLFARKFDSDVDQGVLTALAERVKA